MGRWGSHEYEGMKRGVYMRMLFLDDDRNRCKQVQSFIPSAIIVNRANEAIYWLQTEKQWDVVSLDYDLDGEVMVESEQANTGMEVAQWIGKNRPAILRMIVHSFNPVGSLNMLSVLREAGYCVEMVPFNSAAYEHEEIRDEMA